MRPLLDLGCRQPFGLLPTMRWSPGTGLTPPVGLGAGAASCEASLFSPVVPPACHAQRSSPVASGQPRTMPKLPRPAQFTAFAGDDPARSGLASRCSIGPGLHRPCRARPGRSLVTEDRSAAGVRDRTGRTPDAHAIAHGTGRDTPGHGDTGWNDPGTSAQVEAWWRPGEDRAAQRVGNLGPGARPLERPKSGPRTSIRCLYCRILAL
jgi:hypothetical protein